MGIVQRTLGKNKRKWVWFQDNKSQKDVLYFGCFKAVCCNLMLLTLKVSYNNTLTHRQTIIAITEGVHNLFL